MTNKIVVLSPHPDDVVWSLGGWLEKLSHYHLVQIVTLFDGDPEPLAEQLIKQTPKQKWRQLTDASFRRKEDSKAIASLNCHHISLGNPEAALRLVDSQFEYEEIDDIFTHGNNIASHQIISELKSQIIALLQPKDIVIAPFAIGGHTDHLITFAIAKELENRTAWYAEFPYALSLSTDQVDALCQRQKLDVEPKLYSCCWNTWITAAMQYRSQVLRLFSGRQRFTQQLAQFALQDNGIASCRIWCTRALNFANEPVSDRRKGKAFASGDETFC
ncbi:putative GlcNAc-PI de-N-acetylase [Vibrio crassostreae]|nr:putative GlcNAc-PI de-N-acetylase [Vibrio crassostreae]